MCWGMGGKGKEKDRCKGRIMRMNKRNGREWKGLKMCEGEGEKGEKVKGVR